MMLTLVGCDQQAFMDKFTPKEESAIAKKFISQLIAKNYEPIEQQLDPSIKNESVHTTLEQLATMFPAGEPTNILTLSANFQSSGTTTNYSLTYEYQYPATTLVVSVALLKRDNKITLYGLHATPIDKALKESNRFTFKGKGLAHYLVFAFAIAIPIFIIVTLITCYRTPMAKRKWLWMVFIAVGIAQFSFNWTVGSFLIRPLYAALLGAGFTTAGAYAPVVITLAFPFGALVFWLRRGDMVGKGDVVSDA